VAQEAGAAAAKLVPSWKGPVQPLVPTQG